MGESKLEDPGCNGIPLMVANCPRRKAPSAASVANAATSEVVVRFEFPDGSVAEKLFQMGQTVEVLKAFLASEFDLDMQNIDLEFDGRIMLDPLSIGDFDCTDPSDGFDVYVMIDADTWCRESKGK